MSTSSQLVTRALARYGSIALAGVVLASCEKARAGGASSGRGELGPRHPVAEFLYRPIPVTSTVAIGAPADSANTFVRRLKSARVVTRIGVLDGRPEYVLGKIADVDVDEAGRIYVLDASNSRVRVYERDGRHVTSFGRAGQGPGEFSQARALEVTSRGVYVADLAGVQLFRPKGNEFAYERGWHPGPEPVDLCVLGPDLFVHGTTLRDDPLVYQIDSTRPPAAFGRVYAAPNAIVAVHVNRSRMSCSPATRTIVLGPAAVIGELHAYSAGGTPAWIVAIQGYRPIDFRESRRGTRVGTRTIVPDEGFDRLYALAHSPSGHFVAQVGYISLADYQARAKDYSSLFTFAVDERTGRAVSAGTSLPAIAAFAPNGFLSVEQEPFPRVTIYAW